MLPKQPIAYRRRGVKSAYVEHRDFMAVMSILTARFQIMESWAWGGLKRAPKDLREWFDGRLDEIKADHEAGK